MWKQKQISNKRSPPVGIESGTSVILVWRSPYWANLSSVHAPLDSWSQTIYLESRELYKDLTLAQKGEHQNRMADVQGSILTALEVIYCNHSVQQWSPTRALPLFCSCASNTHSGGDTLFEFYALKGGGSNKTFLLYCSCTLVLLPPSLAAPSSRWWGDWNTFAFNFLNNSLIFNLLTPLESSQFSLYSHGF